MVQKRRLEAFERGSQEEMDRHQGQWNDVVGMSELSSLNGGSNEKQQKQQQQSSVPFGLSGSFLRPRARSSSFSSSSAPPQPPAWPQPPPVPDPGMAVEVDSGDSTDENVGVRPMTPVK